MATPFDVYPSEQDPRPDDGAYKVRPRYALVNSTASLDKLAKALDGTGYVGLDLETTGLDPHRDRVRLLSVSTDTVNDGRFIYVVDAFLVNPTPLWKPLAKKHLVIHNAAFDLAFLSAMGFTAGAVHDTMLLSQVLYAGRKMRHRLSDCAQRELDETLDKTEQASDWSGTLTEEQIVYAARNVDVLSSLREVLAGKISAANLSERPGRG